jgi:hypothetical protein
MSLAGRSMGQSAPTIKPWFRHSAVYVDEILKSARVKSLPVEQAAEFDLIATSRPPALSA